MKKIFILLAATALLGVGCQKQPNNIPMNQDEVFKKKQDCQKYKNEIEKDIDKEEKEKMGGIITYVSIDLGEIFFSDVKNTCMYTATENWVDKLGKIHEAHWIVDILSNDKTKYGWIEEILTPEWSKEYSNYIQNLEYFKTGYRK